MAQNDRANAVFKTCTLDNKENDPPADNREPKQNHEWDTPTRVRVKTLFEAGFSR